MKTRQEKSSEPKVDRKAVARRIREIRGFDLTQGEFARTLGVSQAMLSKYERGRNTPTLDILLKLKAFSGKTIDWIVAGEAGEGI
jgi:transcriptional regulator with XRE-family HTH domain